MTKPYSWRRILLGETYCILISLILLAPLAASAILFFLGGGVFSLIPPGIAESDAARIIAGLLLLALAGALLISIHRLAPSIEKWSYNKANCRLPDDHVAPDTPTSS